jgi:hypothetical protein
MLQHFDTVIAFAAVMLGVSVLVTILTQLINAALGLRGRSLLWGLETLLTQADPRFREHARAIAEKILRHPLLSHTARQRATAIRKKELIPLLEEVMSEEGAPEISLSARSQSTTDWSGGASRAAFTAPKHVIEKVESWFDSVMDRVGERFGLRARWVSAVLAAVIALSFHLDAIALLEKLSTDAELRSSLIQSTNALITHADDVFTIATNAYNEAFFRLRLESDEAKRLANPPNFLSAGQAESWIRTQIEDSLRAEALIREYNGFLEEILKEKTGRLAEVADSLRADFNKIRFVLIPDPYPGLSYNLRELAGILIAGMLLSLGAPFWYNLLKNLASLRPKVAELVQKEQREQKLEEMTAWRSKIRQAESSGGK